MFLQMLHEVKVDFVDGGVRIDVNNHSLLSIHFDHRFRLLMIQLETNADGFGDIVGALM